MSEISYCRMGVSCLPFVGPIVNIFSCSLDICHQIGMAGCNEVIAEVRAILSKPHSNSHEKKVEIGPLLNSQIIPKFSPIAEKLHTLSFCGLVGDLCTIATIVGFVAQGIFAKLMILLIAPYVIFAGYHAMHFYLFHHVMKGQVSIPVQ